MLFADASVRAEYLWRRGGESDGIRAGRTTLSGMVVRDGRSGGDGSGGGVEGWAG